MASQDQSWFKPLFHLEKKGLKKIHRIKHTCCLFDRREYPRRIEQEKMHCGRVPKTILPDMTSRSVKVKDKLVNN